MVISICLASYNGEKYIKEQIDSILEQSFEDFELIIQDDCSNDKTVEIVREYLKKDDRILLYENQKNLGYVKNFETLIKKANGDFIALCDQDDIWHRDKLKILIENIGKNSLIYSNSLLVDEEANSLNIKLSQKLNSEFRGKDKPTDVLTFPISDDMGEIFINLSYAYKKAKNFDREPENYIAFLFIHGLAHILGYDHENDIDAEEMEKFEMKIRKKFKI
jgi:rRNA maturation RNase YbeY